MSKPAIFLFSHIEKTAGMSLYELVKENFPPQAIIGDRIERDVFYTINKANRGELRIICGHFKYGLHDMLGLDGYMPVYATVLRDPVEREVSFYYYRRNRSNISTPAWEPVDDCPTPEEWLLSKHRRRNDQSTFVCGYRDTPSYELAMQRLIYDFAFFGISEYFNATVDGFCKTFGMKKISYPRVNVGERPPMDPRLHARWSDILRETDPIDMRVYRDARKLFEREHRRAIARHQKINA